MNPPWQVTLHQRCLQGPWAGCQDFFARQSLSRGWTELVGKGSAHAGSGREVFHVGRSPISRALRSFIISLSIEGILLRCGKAADFCQKRLLEEIFLLWLWPGITSSYPCLMTYGNMRPRAWRPPTHMLNLMRCQFVPSHPVKRSAVSVKKTPSPGSLWDPFITSQDSKWK